MITFFITCLACGEDDSVVVKAGEPVLIDSCQFCGSREIEVSTG